MSLKMYIADDNNEKWQNNFSAIKKLDISKKLFEKIRGRKIIKFLIQWSILNILRKFKFLIIKINFIPIYLYWSSIKKMEIFKTKIND